MSISDGPITNEPISAEALVAATVTVTVNDTAPTGSIGATITVINHQAAPGCDTTAFPVGHIP